MLCLLLLLYAWATVVQLAFKFNVLHADLFFPTPVGSLEAGTDDHSFITLVAVVAATLCLPNLKSNRMADGSWIPLQVAAFLSSVTHFLSSHHAARDEGQLTVVVQHTGRC